MITDGRHLGVSVSATGDFSPAHSIDFGVDDGGIELSEERLCGSQRPTARETRRPPRGIGPIAPRQYPMYDLTALMEVSKVWHPHQGSFVAK